MTPKETKKTLSSTLVVNRGIILMWYRSLMIMCTFLGRENEYRKKVNIFEHER